MTTFQSTKRFWLLFLKCSRRSSSGLSESTSNEIGIVYFSEMIPNSSEYVCVLFLFVFVLINVKYRWNDQGGVCRVFSEGFISMNIIVTKLAFCILYYCIALSCDFDLLASSTCISVFVSNFYQCLIFSHFKHFSCISKFCKIPFYYLQ